MAPGYIADKYIQKMYQINEDWYYFRKEEENYDYPFYLMNELMGSYLSKEIGLNAVNFQVGCIDRTLGLTSKNFRKPNCNYYFGKYFSPYNSLTGSNLRIDNISSFCMNCQNNEK